MTEIYQDDERRYYEGPLILSILNIVKSYPADAVFDEKQNRWLQYVMEKFNEIATPYPYPAYPTTFGQDTRLIGIIRSVQAKLKAAQTQ